jgi:hypothetical protein
MWALHEPKDCNASKNAKPNTKPNAEPSTLKIAQAIIAVSSANADSDEEEDNK